MIGYSFPGKSSAASKDATWKKLPKCKLEDAEADNCRLDQQQFKVKQLNVLTTKHGTMRRHTLLLLAAALRASARHPGFSIHDDLLAYPQVGRTYP
jgi:hypothetical protein